MEEEQQSHVTLRILNFTLEILSLLTGESVPMVMSGDHVTINVPPPPSLILEIAKERKILKVIKKIVELMTGERVRPSHVTIAVKEEAKQEEDGGLVEAELSEEHKNVLRNPAKRWPRPPHFQDPRKEIQQIPQHDQDDLTNVKAEEHDGRRPVGGSWPLKEGAEMTVKEEDIPAEISTEDDIEDDDDDLPASEEESCITATIDSEIAEGLCDSSSDRSRAAPHGGDRDEKICLECGKGFKLKSALLTHQRIHTGERPYSCPECGKCFIRKEHLSQHQVTHTGEKRFPCLECGKRFTQKASLIKHGRTHMVLAADIKKALEGLLTLFPDKELEEGQVVKENPTIADARLGDRAAPSPEGSTPEASLPGASCKRKPPERCLRPPYFRDSKWKPHKAPPHNQAKNLADIKVVVKEEEEEVCVTSDRWSSEEAGVTSDRWSAEEGDVTSGQWSAEEASFMVIVKAEEDLTHTGPGPVRKGSTDCKMEEDTQDSEDNAVTAKILSAARSVDPGNAGSFIHKDVRKQSVGEKFSCTACGKCFTYQYALRKHMRVHTGERPFPCFQCGKRFIWRENLLQHQIIHSGKKPHSCSECGKSFMFKSVLARHFRTHTGVKPFCCLECGKSFPMKAKLEAHFRIHTGERPFSCAQCGKRFTLKGRLTRHMRRHTGEKMVMCGACGKCFMEKSDLASHQKIHTGERPFACSDCGSCFRKKSDLYRHIKIHTGEKPFGCTDCEFRSARKSELAIHVRTHTGEKPFACTVCEKSFSRNSSLRCHQRDHSHYTVLA